MSRLDALTSAELGLEGLTIDRTSPLPIYAQMRDQLQQVLGRRREARLDTFFTDEEIARHFGVSRMTVRQAIGEMVREGQLYRRKGVGTFITSHKVIESEGPDNVGNFFEQWPRMGHRVNVEMLVFAHVPCPPERAAALGLRPGTPVLYFLRRRIADGVPLVLDYRWVELGVGSKMRQDELTLTSIHEITARHLGSPVGRSKYEIEAARCTREHADLLEMEPDEPVLIRHVDVTASDGSSLWTGESIYRADLYKYRIEINPWGSAASVAEVVRGPAPLQRVVSSAPDLAVHAQEVAAE